ncbi:MAG: hypothetical protein V4722_06925 [Bacteroidota bacterium]
MKTTNRRRWGLLTILVLSVIVSGAQMSINPMLPGSGVYLKSQLWNFSVTSSHTSPLEGKIQLDVKDVQTRQTVLSGVSGKFIIPPGAKVLQAQALQPIQYNYTRGALADLSPNGVLPAGQYQVCYQLFLLNHSNPELAAEECVQLEVEPLSPPLLTYPDNGSVIEQAAPAFTWMPPAPLTMFGNLNYDFLLIEVFGGQSMTDAIQKNLPIQQASLLRQPVLQYPIASGRQLEKGKTYAWQIVARDGNRYAAKSEVWSFTLKGDSVKNDLNSIPYVKLGVKELAPVIIKDGILKIEYINEWSDLAVQATITTLEKSDERPLSFMLDVQKGQNFITYDLNKRAVLTEKKLYELRLVNSRGMSVSMRFIPTYSTK